MSRDQDPDVATLRDSGDSGALLKLVARGRGDVRVRAADALTTLTLSPRDLRKAQKQIGRALKEEESREALTADIPISIAVYRHSLIRLEQLSPSDTLLRSYGVWLDAYIRLLQQHKDIHRNQFKLGVDSDRNRRSQVEGLANRVVSLASDASALSANGSSQLAFILATAGALERLVRLEGRTFLSKGGHQGDHDWTLSRKVYDHLWKQMESCTGLKYGSDQERWSKLRDNILALVLGGELSMTSTAHHDAKTLSLIAKRTDLPAPTDEIVSALFRA